MTEPDDVTDWFDALAVDARAVVRPVFDRVASAMPAGYSLGMHFGMPGWVVPLSRFPDTYNGKPLSYVSLTAGARYHSLYLMGLYSDPDADSAFRAAWRAGGRRLDMGKSCLRFRRLDDVDLDLVHGAVASMPVDRFIEVYERVKR